MVCQASSPDPQLEEGSKTSKRHNATQTLAEPQAHRIPVLVRSQEEGSESGGQYHRLSNCTLAIAMVMPKWENNTKRSGAFDLMMYHTRSRRLKSPHRALLPRQVAVSRIVGLAVEPTVNVYSSYGGTYCIASNV